jgi:hypothetical protein
VTSGVIRDFSMFMKLLKEDGARIARERLANRCDEMKQLLGGLLDAKGKVAEEVHALRKLGKSLRGGFSLFRLGKSSALEIQAIGRLLSGPRDAVSRYNTWRKLEWAEDERMAAAIDGLLEQQTHSAARRPPQETIDWCLARVDAASAGLNEVKSEALAEVVTKGLRKLEKRTLKRCARLDHRAEEDFHEARKAVKALLGAAGFLPEGLITADPKLHDLAELLGDENDLATLSLWLEGHGFTSRFAPGLWRLIAEKRHGLQKEVIAKAAKLRLTEQV